MEFVIHEHDKFLLHGGFGLCVYGDGIDVSFSVRNYV
jgi:hypothetical protein